MLFCVDVQEEDGCSGRSATNDLSQTVEGGRLQSSTEVSVAKVGADKGCNAR